MIPQQRSGFLASFDFHPGTRKTTMLLAGSGLLQLLMLSTPAFATGVYGIPI